MVVGAGIVGVAAACWLQRDGHAVTLVDPEPPGSGASSGNAGCLSPGSIVPLSGPGVLRQVPGWLLDPNGPLALRWRYLPTALPWLLRFLRAGTPAGIEHQAAALAGLLAPMQECLQPLLADAGAEDLVRRDGSLVVYQTRAGWEGAQGAWALRHRHGIVWQELGPDALVSLDPTLARGLYRGVLLPRNGHTLNPQALVARLVAALLRQGGRLVRATATGFNFEGGRLRAVVTDAGPLKADGAVLAAGAHSRVLARMLGDPVPLESERGYHLMLPAPGAVPRYPTLAAEARFVATPMADGMRLTGVVELAGLRAAPDWRRAHALLPTGRTVFPGLSGEGATVWMGHRPSTPDSLPVIGRSRRSADVIHAFGHGHLGLTAAPSTGRLVAQLLGGQTPHIDPSPFAAGRFKMSVRAVLTTSPSTI